jgi:hypothetical protein
MARKAAGLNVGQAFSPVYFFYISENPQVPKKHVALRYSE